MAATYTGPSAREMIQSHSLAKEIIARNGDPVQAVLDPSELALLKRFVADPSSKNEILEDVDMTDPENSKLAGERAQSKGSLVGYVIAQSAAGNEILSGEEMELLRNWFAQS